MFSEPTLACENQRGMYLSDCESGTSTDDTKQQETEFSGTGFIEVQSNEPVYKVMREKFVSQLSSCGYDAQVEAIYRNNFSTPISEARHQSFLLYSRAIESKNGGNANEVYAWYGASMAEIRDILDNGFCIPSQNWMCGNGIHLSPAEKPLNSLVSATPEADGLRCMLLCRVILGNSEVLCPGSRQCNPSSSVFDSGVESLSSPATYVVWTSRMNTHILPEVMVMFKPNRNTSCNGFKKKSTQANSEWMPFTVLVRALSRFLPRDAIELIAKVHVDYKKKKMNRGQMIERVRNIAGDRLLLEIIRSYKGKSSLLRCI